MRLDDIVRRIARQFLPTSVYRMPPEPDDLYERSDRAAKRAHAVVDTWNERHRENWRQDGTNARVS